jgi:hypothetical protein
MRLTLLALLLVAAVREQPGSRGVPGKPDFALFNWHRQVAANGGFRMDGMARFRIGSRPLLVPRNDLGLFLLGDRETSVSLGALGELRVDPSRAVSLGPYLLSGAGGARDLEVPVPNDPSIRWKAVYMQGFVVTPGSSSPAHVTNTVREVIK